MCNEDGEPSILYVAELVDKIFALPGKIKALQTLLNNPYNGRDVRRIEQQVKQELRQEITDDMFFICDNLNRPELLGNRMLKLASAARYGWSGRGLGKY
jgi:hypothetical protein